MVRKWYEACFVALIMMGNAGRYIVFFGALATACSSSSPLQVPGEIQVSTVERDTAPNVSQAATTAAVANNTAFALDLYGQLAQESGNVFYSPLSISTALAMTLGGARGATESQMAEALRFELPQAELHPALNWLDLQLQSPKSDDIDYQLTIENAVFGQTDYPFGTEYVDLLTINYDTPVALLDFEANPDKSRQDINDWIAAVTEDRIPELFGPREITDRTRLVLANAAYFKAAWKFPFNPFGTRTQTFHAPLGEVSVPMMSVRPRESTYAAGADYEAITLPYVGDTSDMVIIMPDDLTSFEASFDPARLAEISSSLEPRGQILNVPKFTFRFEADLRPALQALGMVDAFDERADFSGMTTAEQLALTAVVHEAFVAIDENGTEATAATGVVATPVSQVPELFIDRPFLFLIRDIDTGSIIFLGRVVDPSQ